MSVEMAEKRGLTEVKPQVYDEALHARFVRWMEQNGAGLAKIARMISRNTAQLSHYINIQAKPYPGDVQTLEKDIRVLLRREEDKQLVRQPGFKFCHTSASILLWEVLQYCDQKRKMGVAIAPSGSGKSATALEYQRQNRATILITANITTRSLGATLRLIADKTGGRGGKNVGRTVDALIEVLIKRFRGSDRLLIVDEAHFLPYEGLEALRKFNDCSGIGVAYLGQERLYDQMVGRTDKAKLFDQIFGRILMKRDRVTINKEDAVMVAETVWPGLDKDEMKFAFEIARGPGRLHQMKNILDMGRDIKRQNPELGDMEALIEAQRFSMQNERKA